MLRREMESAGISIQNAAFLEQHVGTVEMIYKTKNLRQNQKRRFLLETKEQSIDW